MYIQFQTFEEKSKKLGAFVGSSNPCYANNDEAKKKFFDSLYDQTVFWVGSDQRIQLLITSAKQTGKGSSYLEFTAIAFDFRGGANIPVKGQISFRV